MDQFDRLGYQSPERRKELLEEISMPSSSLKTAVRRSSISSRDAASILRSYERAARRSEHGCPLRDILREVRTYFETIARIFASPSSPVATSS